MRAKVERVGNTLGDDTGGAVVHCEVVAGVATITLDSPANRNALSRRLLADLHVALDVATRSRVIVLTHTGPTFCAGADLKERGSGPTDATPMASAMQRLIEAPQPTIAELTGSVRAGGVGLMAACDLVVVQPDVTFAFTEVRIGVAPAIISVPILRRVPWSQLAAAFLTGETFDADEARAMGLVTHVADDAAATVSRLTAGILAGAPRAVAVTKALLHRPQGDSLAADFAEMRALSEALFASAEAAEGMLAFTERRAPDWSAVDAEQVEA
jgi:enoyl-CoA hydratase/carnithine racemase